MNVYVVRVSDDTKAVDSLTLKIFYKRENAINYYNEVVTNYSKKYDLQKFLENKNSMVLKQNDYFNLFCSDFNIEVEIIKKEVE